MATTTGGLLLLLLSLSRAAATAASTTAGLVERVQQLRAEQEHGGAYTEEIERELAAAVAVDTDASPAVPGRRRSLQQSSGGTTVDLAKLSVGWNKQLPSLVPDKKGGFAGGVCHDGMASNTGQRAECVYDCGWLTRHYFGKQLSAKTQCFVYDNKKQAWPEALTRLKKKRTDWEVYASGKGEDLSFVVGGGRNCRNVTITEEAPGIGGSKPHNKTEIKCIFDGYHVHNHTYDKTHTVSVVGYAQNKGAIKGGKTKFVVGDCTNMIVRVKTTKVTSSKPTRWRIADHRPGDHEGSFTTRGVNLAGQEEMICMFDNNYTFTKIDDGSGWQGTVEVVSFVDDNSIYVPADEEWIIQGASTNGVPVELDARISSGNPYQLTNASIVMRHVRFVAQQGLPDRWGADPKMRWFSKRSRVGGAFQYEGGFGSHLEWDHVVIDHCGGDAVAGGAIHILGRGEDMFDSNRRAANTKLGVTVHGRPLRGWELDGSGLTFKMRHTLVWAVGGFINVRTINVQPLTASVKNCRFIDNDAIVGHHLFWTWYNQLQNKSGHTELAIADSTFETTSKCADADWGCPFTKRSWCKSGLIHTGLFGFGGQTMNPKLGATIKTNLTNVDSLRQTSWYLPGWCIQFDPDADIVANIWNGGSITNNVATSENFGPFQAPVLYWQLRPECTALVTNTHWEKNTPAPGSIRKSTTEGGALIFLMNGAATVKNSRFIGNIAGPSGGAIAFKPTIKGKGVLKILSCLFKGNKAHASGGAVSFSGTMLNVHSSHFLGNMIEAPDNTADPKDGKRRTAVNVWLYTGGMGNNVGSGLAVWKIDGASPPTKCNLKPLNNKYNCLLKTRPCTTRQDAYELLDPPVRKQKDRNGKTCNDGEMPASEIIFGSNRTADTPMYLPNSNYGQILHLEPGEHTLWHGTKIRFSTKLSTWVGNGWIEVIGAQSKIYPSFDDNRGTADQTGYTRYPSCVLGDPSDNSNAYVGFFFCPNDEYIWSSTRFNVGYGEGGAIHTTSTKNTDTLANRIWLDNSTFQGNAAGNGVDVTVIGANGLRITGSSLLGGQKSLFTTITADTCKPGSCKPGHQCVQRGASLYCNVPCPINAYGDGEKCISCGRGQQPNSKQTACVPCEKTSVSAYGVCQSCIKDRVPDKEQIVCIQCENGKISNSTHCNPCDPGFSPDRAAGVCKSCVLEGIRYVSRDGQKCELCAAGKEPNSLRTRCEQCPVGKYSQKAGCVSCSPGQQVKAGQTGCESCSTGTVSAGTKCSQCSPGKEPNAGKSQCVSCTEKGAEFFSATGFACSRCLSRQTPNSGRTACVCKPGTYQQDLFGQLKCNGVDGRSSSHLGDKCVECPSCLTCSAGQATLKSGWALYGPNSAYECPVAAGCAVAPLFNQTIRQQLWQSTDTGHFDAAIMAQQCTTGYAGPVCGTCAADFSHMKVGQECEPCKDGVLNVPLVLGVLCGGLILAALAFTGGLQLLTDHGVLTDFRIYLSFGQLLAQMDGVLDVSFPSPIPELVGFVKMLFLDVRTLIKMDCWSVGGFWGKLLTNLLLVPLAYTLGCFALYHQQRRAISLVIASGGTDESAYTTAAVKLQSHLFIGVFLLYPIITSTLFRIPQCRSLGPHEWHEDDFTVDCDGSTFIMVVVAAIIGILLVPIGVPLAFFVQMHRAKAAMDGQVFETALGGAKLCGEDAPDEDDKWKFLIQDMRPNLYYFEVVNYLRKALLGGICIIIGRGTLSQLYFVSTVESIFLMIHMYCWPYILHKHNVIEACGHLSLLLTYVITFILENEDPDAFTNEWFPRAGYSWIIVVLYTVLMPFPTVWFAYKDYNHNNTEHATHATHANPLNLDDDEFGETENPVHPDDNKPDSTATKPPRSQVARMQRISKQATQKVQELKAEQQALNRTIAQQDKKIKQLEMGGGGSSIGGATDQPTTGDDGAPTPVSNLMQQWITIRDDDTLNEENRAAAQLLLDEAAAKQIEQIRVQNRQERDRQRLMATEPVPTSLPASFATSKKARSTLQQFLGEHRLLHHESAFIEVGGWALAAKDLKDCRAEDLDAFAEQMSYLEKQRLIAAVESLKTQQQVTGPEPEPEGSLLQYSDLATQ